MFGKRRRQREHRQQQAETGLRITWAGKYQGFHSYVGATSIDGQGLDVGVIGEPADEKTAGDIASLQNQSFQRHGLSDIGGLDPKSFKERAKKLGQAWESKGKKNDDKKRAMYMYVEDGKIHVGYGDSKWEDVLAAREVLGELDNNKLQKVFDACREVSVETTSKSGQKVIAFMPAPQATSAVLSVNLIPVVRMPDGTYNAILTLRPPTIPDHPNAVATIGGGIDVGDIRSDGTWDPSDTIQREKREEMADSLEQMTVLSGAFGPQADGQCAVSLTADITGTPFEKLLEGRMKSKDGQEESSGFLNVPLTLVGLTAALCAPESLKGEYKPHDWTSWAIASVHVAAKAVLKPQEYDQLVKRTETVEAMKTAWEDVSKNHAQVANTVAAQIPGVIVPGDFDLMN